MKKLVSTIATVLLALALPGSAAAAARTLYAQPQGACSGYPRLPIGMAKGVPIANADARYPVYGGPDRANGIGPAANALILTPAWGRLDPVRPQGSPVGLAVARDGAIWVADDKAGTIIRIAANSAH